MSRELAYLNDMLTSAKLAREYVQGKSLDGFLQDVQCQDSVLRRLVLIGEAARRVSEEGRNKYSAIPWREIIGMRNALIHEYEEVDLQVVWTTVQQRVPDLIRSLEEAMPADLGS
jgi:uncharacterized protein with HEPN domain